MNSIYDVNFFENDELILSNFSTIVIKQKVEPLEQVTGIETCNQYFIYDINGNLILEAKEESNMLARQFLKSHRPFKLNIKKANEENFFYLKSPFYFYFSKSNAYYYNNKMNFGCVKEKFTILKKKYIVYDSNGKEIFIISGWIWDFKIYRDGKEVGIIKKNWIGVLEEIFADNDNFYITFPEDSDEKERKLLLTTMLRIDMTHFENNSGSRGYI